MVRLADSNSNYPTPPEVLAEEIEAVERRQLTSWAVWAGAAMLGAALIGAFAALVLVAPKRVVKAVPVALLAPRGAQNDVPRRFQWDPVPGAAVYIVAVTEVGTGNVIVLRPVYETALTPHDSEFSRFDPGSYTWSVEAKARDGSILSHGEAVFSLGARVGRSGGQGSGALAR
jgi:hypothetical protein